jgi:hypothetical protein
MNYWGDLKLVRIFGSATGFVDASVKCLETNECEDDKEWIVNIHAEIIYRGYFDWGPNIPATIIGAKFGGWYGIIANVAILLAKGSNRYL